MALGAGCVAPSEDVEAASEGALADAEDGGAGKDESSPSGAGDEGAIVAPYGDDDVATALKMRWSLEGREAVEGLQAELRIAPSNPNGKFELQAYAPLAQADVTGKGLVVYFGKGQEVVGTRTYDCAANEAIVVLVQKDGSKAMTAVSAAGGGPRQRSCKVVVDQATELVGSPGWPSDARHVSFKRVTGHVEAELGPRDDGQAPVVFVRAAFAAIFAE